MTIPQIHKSCVLIILLGVLHSAVGQYKEELTKLSTPHEFGQANKEEQTNDFIDAFNPLGPNAQSMRNESYLCVEQPVSRLERGLWIKMGEKQFLYENNSVLLLNDQEELTSLNVSKEDKAVSKTVKMLNKLEKKSPYARNIIHTLQNSDNKFVISLVNAISCYMLLPLPNDRLGVLNNNAYAFQILENDSLIVDYAPFDKIGSGAEIRWGPEHKIIGLAHELSHAYDANYGLLDDQLMQAYGEIMSAREIRALFHENMIRQELHLKLRVNAKTGGALIWDGKPYTYPLPVSARY